MQKKIYILIRDIFQKRFWEIILWLSLIVLLYSCIFWWLSLWDEREEGKKILFLLDVSESMNVNDMDGDSRLEIAKKDIIRYISHIQGYEYGLTIFAGEARRVIPFTSQKDIFATLVSWVDSHSISIQWSKIDAALEESIKGIWQQEELKILLYSDGHEGDIKLSKSTRNLVQEYYIDLAVIGVGKKQYSYVPNLRYKWSPVASRLEKKSLQRIASDLWGKYYNFWESIDLNKTSQSASYDRALLVSLILWMVFVVIFYRRHYV